MSEQHHLRYHVEHSPLLSPFGPDWLGQKAEGFARFFGTPRYLMFQTVLVLAWIAINGDKFVSWDPYPFILLNLIFSTQAAYAAPMILLAQTRQTERERVHIDADARHREDLAQTQIRLVTQDTELTQQVAELAGRIEALTRELHAKLVTDKGT